MSDTDHRIETSFATEAVRAGLLVHQHPRWPPRLTLATGPERPWFPTVIGMYGGGTSTTRLTGSARHTTSDKVRTASLLQAAGVPTPQGRTFLVPSVVDVAGYVSSLGGRAVVKPVTGNARRGVSLGVRTAADVQAALAHLREDGFGGAPFLVQRQAVGSELRITATRSRVLSAIHRVPVSVTGDGVSSVRTLLQLRAQRLGHHDGSLDGPSLPSDAELELALTESGLSDGSVLAPGEQLSLTSLVRRRHGGERIEVSRSLHPSLQQLAVDAVQAIPGLDVGGIDVILEHGHACPVAHQTVTVLEVNAGAAVGNCLAPTSGEPVNVYRLILEDLASDAGLLLREPDDTTRLAVRCGHRLSVPGVALTQHLRRLGAEVEGVPGEREPVLVVGVRTGALHAVLCVLGQHADALTMLALPSASGTDVRDVAALLQPPPLVPEDHQRVLAASFDEGSERTSTRIRAGHVTHRRAQR